MLCHFIMDSKKNRLMITFTYDYVDAEPFDYVDADFRILGFQNQTLNY